MEDESVEEVTVETTVSSLPPTVSGNENGVSRVAASIASISIDSSDNDSQLTKQSCYDSGIDMRDLHLPVVVQAKKNYSDADIVLSSDWVPPITIAPTDLSESRSGSISAAGGSSAGNGSPSLSAGDTSGYAGIRKKASSVSFSVDDNSEHQQFSTSSDKTGDNNRKNKMLKRLSYPLSGLIEGFTGDQKPNDSIESAPNTGDSNQSVFSKVFSRWVRIGEFAADSGWALFFLSFSFFSSSSLF